MCRQQPRHIRALHLLGIIALQTRHTERAVELFGRTIALNPDYGEAYYNRGLALYELKRPADALANYDRAIALIPGFPATHNSRGNALIDLEHPANAMAPGHRCSRSCWSKAARGCRHGSATRPAPAAF